MIVEPKQISELSGYPLEIHYPNPDSETLQNSCKQITKKSDTLN